MDYRVCVLCIIVFEMHNLLLRKALCLQVIFGFYQRPELRILGGIEFLKRYAFDSLMDSQ